MVAMLRVLKHVGAQLPWENEEVTPLGNPVADRLTTCAVPLSWVAVIIVTPLLACARVSVPPFASENSNAGGGGAGGVTVGVGVTDGAVTGGATTTGGVTGGAATGIALTVKVKPVVFVSPPPVPVMVSGKLPAGVVPEVLIVTTVVHVGLQLREENEAVAPAGSPTAVNETAWLLPNVNAALIVSVAEAPACTERFPALDSEKSNAPGGGVGNNVPRRGALVPAVSANREPAQASPTTTVHTRASSLFMSQASFCMGDHEILLLFGLRPVGLEGTIDITYLRIYAHSTILLTLLPRSWTFVTEDILEYFVQEFGSPSPV